MARTLGAVELLIEMAADDRALRHRPARELATALLRFAAACPVPAPSGTLGVAVPGTGAPALARVYRLLKPVPPPPAVRVAALTTAVLVAVVPLLLYALPG